MTDPNSIMLSTRFQAEKARRLQERTRNTPRLHTASVVTTPPMMSSAAKAAKTPQVARLAQVTDAIPLTRVEYEAWDLLKMFPKTVPVYVTVDQLRDHSYKQLLSQGSALIDPKFLPSIDTLQSPDDPTGFARENDLERAVSNLWSVMGPQLQSLTQQIGAIGVQACVSDQVQKLKSDVRDLEQQAVDMQQQTSADIRELARLKYPAPVIVSTASPNTPPGMLEVEVRTGLTNEIVRQVEVSVKAAQALVIAHGSNIQLTLPAPSTSERIFTVFPRMVNNELGVEPLAHMVSQTNVGVPSGQVSYMISFTPSDDVNVARYEVFSTLRSLITISSEAAPGSTVLVRVWPVPSGELSITARTHYDGMWSEIVSKLVDAPNDDTPTSL